MMSIVTRQITLARKVNNYLSPASAWDSTTAHHYVVPADKRWILLYGIVNLDASGTLSVYVRDAADKIVGLLATYAAGTGVKAYPIDAYWSGDGPIVLDAGEYIRLVCGAAQGAGAYSSCVVLEFEA